MIIKSHSLSGSFIHCKAVDSSSAVPTTLTGASSSSVAIRLSRIRGLSSTIYVLIGCMDCALLLFDGAPLTSAPHSELIEIRRLTDAEVPGTGKCKTSPEYAVLMAASPWAISPIACRTSPTAVGLARRCRRLAAKPTFCRR